MRWTDTHAHIYASEFDADRGDMIARARLAQVGMIAMPNIDRTSIDAMLEVELKYEECVPMMGLHPCYVKKGFERDLYEVETWLAKRRFLAVGEIGTDLYWDKTYWNEQQEAFKVQVGWAKKYNLPVVIHCRESVRETIDLIKPFAGHGLTGIFHCYSGTPEDAKEIEQMGFYFGIGGVATFKNGGLDKTLPSISRDRIVLETDSPYLAPVPHRGKRNEPEYIRLVATRVAGLLGVSEEELLTITDANVRKVFGLESRTS